MKLHAPTLIALLLVATVATLLAQEVPASRIILRTTDSCDTSTTVGPQICAGTAAPEGSVTAPAGSLYLRTTGTTYRKSTTTGATGWVELGRPITSAEIVDATIANVDVSPTAAIAWAKVSKTGAALGDVTTYVPWTDVPYNAANFTLATGTWTVEPADVVTLAYTIVDKTMLVAFVLDNTSVSTTTSNLRIAIPAGRIAARAMAGGGRAFEGKLAVGNMIPMTSAGGSTINIEDFGATWLASTNGTSVRGRIAFQVQ